MTSKQSAVLAYVVEHPGCTTKDVACAIQRYRQSAVNDLEALTALGWLARQDGLWGQAYTWWPEQQALVAASTN